MSTDGAPGHAHDHPHDPSGELFPRQVVSALVAESETARLRRERWQPWVLGAGLAALALGLPSAAVFGARAVVADAAAGVPHPALALGPLLRGLARALDLPLERAGYLVSGLAYGACLPTLTGALRRFGFDARNALLSALTALASPLAWTGATLPGSFGIGLLGATVLLRVAVAGARPGVASAAWLVAAVLHAENALLWPVALLAERRGGGARGTRGSAAALAGLVAWVALHAGLGTWAGGAGPGAGASALRWSLGPAFALAGLAWAWLGPWALFVVRRAPEEAPPPRWLAVGYAGALPAAMAMGALRQPLGTWLVVAAAVGLADLWGRALGERLAGRAAVLLALQVATTVLVAAGLVRADPDRAWRAQARSSLEPSDVVLTADPTHAYLLVHRWGVATIELPSEPGAVPADVLEEALLRATRSGGRAVLDGLEPSTGPGPLGADHSRLWRFGDAGLEPSP